MGSPRSVVATQVYCDKISKELAGGNRTLQRCIFSDLCNSRGSEALTDRISDLERACFNGTLEDVNSKLTPSGLRTPSSCARSVLQTPLVRASSTPEAGRIPSPASIPDTPFFVWSPCEQRHRTVGLRLDSASRSAGPFQGTSTSLPCLHPDQHLNPKLRMTDDGDSRAARRKVKPDYAAHLRRCPIQMGEPDMLTSTYMAACMGPAQRARDPKWSTDLKKMDQRNSDRIKYNSRLTASTTGSYSPEDRFLKKPLQ